MIQRARELLAGRPIGMALATRFGGMPGAPWWQRQDRSGGMLIEMHTHAVDILRYLVGEVETAYAQADRLLMDRPGMDIADVSAATLRFACGAVGGVANSCALEGGLRLPGAGGTHILARGLALNLGGEGSASFEGGRSEPSLGLRRRTGHLRRDLRLPPLRHRGPPPARGGAPRLKVPIGSGRGAAA